MDDAIRILVADASKDAQTLLRSAIEQQPDLHVVACVSNGPSAYEQVLALRPDVLLTELLLPGMDGVSLLRSLKRASAMPPTIVISAFVTDRLGQALSRLGVEDYMAKPCFMDELVERVRELAAAHPAPGSGSRKDLIRDVLMACSIPAHLSGYRYLQHSLAVTMEDRELLQGVTKVLYPAVARKYRTNARCVERSMRCAIQRGWELGSPERRAAYFGANAMNFPTAPGIAKFLSAAVEFLQHGYEDVHRQ